MNILFVCSRNKWRSRTAEEIFKHRPFDQVQSAGTEKSARTRLTKRILEWSDIVMVMEQHHKKRIRQDFPEIYTSLDIHVLEIPDDYGFMDPELIESLRQSVIPILEKY